MKFGAGFAFTALASMVSGAAPNLHKRLTPLDVVLTPAGNSAVTATITNNGDRVLNLLNKGTVLDDADSQKLGVMQAGEWVPFEGTLFTIDLDNLPESAFTEISAGETITVELNAAELHDLSPGGDYDLIAQGAIPYAESGSFTLTGKAIPFRSNILSMTVDGALAAKVRRSLQRRTELVHSQHCTNPQLEIIAEAHAACVSIANKAAAAASNGTASKMNEYFKSSSVRTRTLVADRLRAISSECSSLTAGATTTTCFDEKNYCSRKEILAYATPHLNAVAYCPLWFNTLPSLTKICHKQDRATTVLHELTHTPAVYGPGTDDITYGYGGVIMLTTAQALINADTYANFANAIWAGGDC